MYCSPMLVKDITTVVIVLQGLYYGLPYLTRISLRLTLHTLRLDYHTRITNTILLGYYVSQGYHYCSPYHTLRLNSLIIVT